MNYQSFKINKIQLCAFTFFALLLSASIEAAGENGSEAESSFHAEMQLEDHSMLDFDVVTAPEALETKDSGMRFLAEPDSPEEDLPDDDCEWTIYLFTAYCYSEC